LLEFNFTFVPETEFIPLVFAARDSAGNLIGGLAGEVMPGWKWLFISLLWISESHRLQGIGTQLMRAVEDEARRQGCAYAYTMTFQALGFYEKLGYVVWGVQEDFPPGHRRCFVSKPLG
jgi:GNAT superfamily N-acetyltransferase